MARRKRRFVFITGSWSKDETSFLKKRFRNTSTREIAQDLGRSIASVQSKASKLGLLKTKKYLRSIGRA